MTSGTVVVSTVIAVVSRGDVVVSSSGVVSTIFLVVSDDFVVINDCEVETILVGSVAKVADAVDVVTNRK